LTYCASHNLSYLSGFLELMAPFFILHSSGLPIEHCYAYFACFMRKYFPYKFLVSNVLTIEERGKWIQNFSLYLGNLLTYHSRKIANLFQEAQLETFTFGYSWIFTFFFIHTKLEVVYEILNQYFAEGDQQFFAYLFVAIILSKENVIQYVTRYLLSDAFSTKENVTNIFELARKLRDETPLTFENVLKQFYIQNEPAVEPSSILEIHPSEIVDFWLKKNHFNWKDNQNPDKEDQKDIEFKILDLRCELGTSPLPDSSRLKGGSKFRERADLILERICADFPMSHKCILQLGDTATDEEKPNVEYVIKKLESNRVSIIKGGFEGILEELRRRNIDSTIIQNRKLSFFERLLGSLIVK